MYHWAAPDRQRETYTDRKRRTQTAAEADGQAPASESVTASCTSHCWRAPHSTPPSSTINQHFIIITHSHHVTTHEHTHTTVLQPFFKDYPGKTQWLGYHVTTQAHKISISYIVCSECSQIMALYRSHCCMLLLYCNGNSTSLPSGVSWWIKQRWIFTGWGQCFGFPSVLWHC